MKASPPCEAESEVQSGNHSTGATWSRLVARVQAGEPSGLEELYRVFSKGVRFYLCRHVGPQELEDRLHDVFLIITQSIQRGELREPERLMGYVRTIVRRQVAAHIDVAVQARNHLADLASGIHLTDQHPDPERRAIENQRIDLALRMLNSIPKRDREVLMRFYLKEQQPDQICQAMGLTETQFRLIKSRAKARFGELGKRRFSLRAGFRSSNGNS
jgi:RNA polymerase sigma-70 factor (ECF subfamily)